MKRSALVACAGLAAAGFLVGRAVAPGTVTVEPPAPTAAARPILVHAAQRAGLTVFSVRAIVREELTAAAGSATPSEPPQTDSQEAAAALDDAGRVLADGMADGRWTDDDRLALTRTMSRLGPDEARQLLSVLFPAINQGRLELKTTGGPI